MLGVIAWGVTIGGVLKQWSWVKEAEADLAKARAEFERAQAEFPAQPLAVFEDVTGSETIS